MNLAVVCEIPEPIQMSGNLMDLGFDQNAETAFALDGGFLQCKDLSANAAKSARDAFAYCQGPFSEMEFICAKVAAVSPRLQCAKNGTDWILFMAHDCLIDIQALEEMGSVLQLAVRAAIDATMIRFLRWGTGGLSGGYSRFCFQKARFAESGYYPIEAPRRILIEPEDTK